MIFNSLPQDFSSLQEPLIYTLSTQEQEPQDLLIEICSADGGQVLATKQLYAVSEAEVDIAPLLRECIIPTLPTESLGTGFVDCGCNVSVYLKVGDVQSATRCFQWAKVEPSTPLTMLSEQTTNRAMAADECDWIGVFSNGSKECNIHIETFGKECRKVDYRLPKAGQQLFVLVASEMGDCDQIEVEIVADDALITKLYYDIKSNLRGARRVGWLNGNISPEIYTFPMRKSLLIEATRRHLERQWGRGAGQVERDGELKLISAYEPSSQLETLAKIVHSPKVWLMRGCSRQDVDLLTERVMLTPAERLGFIEIDIRAAKEGEEL